MEGQLIHREDNVTIFPVKWGLWHAGLLGKQKRAKAIVAAVMPKHAVFPGVDGQLASRVLGDYNQRIPRAGEPVNVAGSLADAVE